jgi:branched-chain amino acid transport system permease protein
MFMQLVISGIALGSIYALIGLALVLVHKSTDVVNFSQGEMATFSTFVALMLLTKFHLPLIAVVILALPIGAALGVTVERFVMRPLAGTSPINALIVTIGLWILFHNGSGWIWGYDPYTFPSLFSPEPVTLFGAKISMNSLGTIGISLVIMVGLYVFFEFTREGTAMRAANMNRRAAQLMGVRIDRVSMISWGLAGSLSMLSGILVAPTLFLDFEMMVSVLLKAFAGAILGGFNSLPGAVVGCLVIGIAENLFGAFVSNAFRDVFAFVIIVAVLMVRPAGLFSGKLVKKV